jgi:hypothetical protein
MVVAACNRTAPRIGADIACAVDRAMVDEYLRIGVYHNCAMVIGDEVFRTSLGEMVPLPTGLIDAPRADGGNIFIFARHLNGTGTGSAAFQTFATMGCDVIFLAGFDGSADPRTRWQGSDGYRAGPTNPKLLDEWARQIGVAAQHAIQTRTVGTVATSDRSACLAARGVGRIIPEKRSKDALRFVLQMRDLCRREPASCPR